MNYFLEAALVNLGLAVFFCGATFVVGYCSARWSMWFTAVAVVLMVVVLCACLFAVASRPDETLTNADFLCYALPGFMIGSMATATYKGGLAVGANA
jgi:hypothetical protein